MDLVHTETIRAKGFEGGYQKAVMPSGLTVLLYPTEGLSTAHCLLGCKVGSQDCAFFDGEEEVRIPAGVAHFLEHKLFESEEGDLFLKFAKTGASANAYTSFDRTCYLFTATQNVAQSVDILLGQIGAPYLTDENVEKEKGIIAQEIKMYDDDPDWRSTFDLLGCLYHNDPVKEDIAGTVDSIQKIASSTTPATWCWRWPATSTRSRYWKSARSAAASPLRLPSPCAASGPMSRGRSLRPTPRRTCRSPFPW